jgi:hypothetical protein
MKFKTWLGLHGARTRPSLGGDAQSHRVLLRLANLELRRTLCQRVREAARRHIREVENQMSEIEAEQARLLGEPGAERPVGRSTVNPPPADPAADGFSLQY